MVPTPLGESVLTFCVREFPQLFNYDFTAQMEARLDAVAKGDEMWKEVCRDTWASYKDRYETLMDKASIPSNSEKVKDFGNGLKAVLSKNGLVLVQESTDGEKKIATFLVTDETGATHEEEKHFDMIHVTPPQSAPDFIRSSPLVDANGWVDVDKYTLQHKKYANVFSLGDVTNTPNAKTGAAVRKQAPVLVTNLLALMGGKELSGKYTGYGSCPIVVGYGKLILAEFGYDNAPMETFPFDQTKPRWRRG